MRRVALLLLLGGFTALPVFAESETEAHALYEQSLDHWIARDVQLQKTAQRILVAGAELCGERVAPVLGAAVLDVSKLPRALRPVAESRFGKGRRFIVTEVFEGGAAEQGGLHEGDVIRARNEKKIESITRLYAPRRVGGEASKLTFHRDGAEQSIVLPHIWGCEYPVWITVSDEANAYADGKTIRFTDAYLRLFDGEDSRAAIVGHELAHNVLGHSRRSNHGDRWASRRDERQADYLGMYLAARAGYVLTEANWRRFNRLGGLEGLERGSSHPTYPERELAVKATIAEIERKREAGLPLVPENR